MRRIGIPVIVLALSSATTALAAPRARRDVTITAQASPKPGAASRAERPSADGAPAAAKKPAKKAAGKGAKKASPPPVEIADPEPAPEPEPAPPPAEPTLTSAAVAKDSAATGEDASGADPRPVSVAPVLGYATSQANLGVGLRGGYTIDRRVYIGGTFVYHLGSSEETTLGGDTLSSSVRLFYPGVEAGYELPLGPVRVRPYAGMGALFISASTTMGAREASDTRTSFALWPGCTVTYDVPESNVFVGGDTRLLIATAGGDPSFGAFVTAGMRF
ncbi:MAG: porin family protein [Labilithrix sp.]|nr:porin family protein [Labilithrix sp.]